MKLDVGVPVPWFATPMVTCTFSGVSALFTDTPVITTSTGPIAPTGVVPTGGLAGGFCGGGEVKVGLGPYPGGEVKVGLGPYQGVEVADGIKSGGSTLVGVLVKVGVGAG